MYLMRLDDASEYMDIKKWKRMEELLDKYRIKPIYGIIPANEDPELLKYGRVEGFWNLMVSWKDKGWVPALHGYTHVFETDDGGINPVNSRSEFAGVSLDRQRQKIREGYTTLKEHGILPTVFFAPAHTFDKNTLVALKEESPIRVISDTVANDVYFDDGFYFIPQQSGHCRKLPFKTTTLCYHPNIMRDSDFYELEIFIRNNRTSFKEYNDVVLSKRTQSVYDKLIQLLYFWRRK